MSAKCDVPNSERRPNLGRHSRNCSVGAHPKGAEIEAEFVAGEARLPSPKNAPYQMNERIPSRPCPSLILDAPAQLSGCFRKNY